VNASAGRGQRIGFAVRWSGAQWYLLLLFLAIHVMLNVDRAILSVVAEAIKHEFNLNDTQLGILIGLGYSVFYSVAGLALGWAADHLNRRTVLSVCVGIFGLATTFATMSRTFVHLLILRLFVGAGEAGGAPAMVSMLADRFGEDRRGLAMSIFYAGAPLGLLLTFKVCGQVAAEHGWRAAFLVAGIPAVVLAVLAAVTVRDSARRSGAVSQGMPFSAAIKHIFAQPTAVKILISVIFYSAPLTAMIAFLISFLMRTHGLGLADASALLALSFGIVGAIGAPLSGQIIDLLARRDVRWRTWWCALVLAASILLSWAALMASSMSVAAVLFIVWGLFSNAISGPAMSTYQSVLAPQARGVGTSVYYLVGNLIGVTIGPLLVGLISDALQPSMGNESLRYSLVAIVALNLISCVLLFRSSRTLAADMKTAEVLAAETPA
jgi:MFS family permease